MCRSIKTLRTREVVASDEEIRAAAKQFVRKIAGMREAPKRDPEPFEAAVDEIAAVSRRMLEGLAARRSS
ncbi:MAG: DUF2277 domain-containing protein [Chloroflexi bacterium]|nr:DUF2277 domain-containing protein [Chloroflexota bacterium]